MAKSNINHADGCKCPDCTAAAVLAQGSNKASGSAPVAFGMKDQSVAGQKLTGR
jgi:hypothetical protein